MRQQGDGVCVDHKQAPAEIGMHQAPALEFVEGDDARIAGAGQMLVNPVKAVPVLAHGVHVNQCAVGVELSEMARDDIQRLGLPARQSPIRAASSVCP